MATSNLSQTHTSTKTVLITHIDSFVGLHVLRAVLLLTDYDVIAGVIRDYDAVRLRRIPVLKVHDDRIHYHCIPRGAMADAYDTVIRMADAVIHLPYLDTSTPDPMTDVMATGLNTIKIVLSTVAKCEKVQKLIVMLSIGAIAPSERPTGCFNVTEDLPYRVFPAGTDFSTMSKDNICAATEALSLRLIETTEGERRFPIDIILPGTVIGTDMRCTHRDNYKWTYNSMALAPLFRPEAQQVQNPVLVGGLITDVSDLAKLHARCLRDERPRARWVRRLVLARADSWEDVLRMARRMLNNGRHRFRSNRGLHEGQQTYKTQLSSIDLGDASELLGAPLRRVESTVMRFMMHYDRLKERERNVSVPVEPQEEAQEAIVGEGGGSG